MLRFPGPQPRMNVHFPRFCECWLLSLKSLSRNFPWPKKDLLPRSCLFPGTAYLQWLINTPAWDNPARTTGFRDSRASCDCIIFQFLLIPGLFLSSLHHCWSQDSLPRRLPKCKSLSQKQLPGETNWWQIQRSTTWDETCKVLYEFVFWYKNTESEVIWDWSHQRTETLWAGLLRWSGSGELYH